MDGPVAAYPPIKESEQIKIMIYDQANAACTGTKTPEQAATNLHDNIVSANARATAGITAARRNRTGLMIVRLETLFGAEPPGQTIRRYGSECVPLYRHIGIGTGFMATHDTSSPAINCAYVDCSEGQIHLRRAGHDGPAVLLFHQTPMSSRMYQRALPCLGRRMRAIAFDTPGYGNSTPPPAPASLDGYADRLAAVITKLSVGPAVLAGFSTGSAMALAVAERLGTDATQLVLSGTPVQTPDELAGFQSALTAAVMQQDGLHCQQAWATRMRNLGAAGGLEQVQAATADMLHVFERRDWALRAVMADDIPARLRRLTVPVLFLTVTADKLAEPNRRAAALVPGAQMREYPDAAPHLCWTDPEAYAEAVFSVSFPAGN